MKKMPKSGTIRLQSKDYQLLADFRHLLRRFLCFSEAVTTREGFTSQQYQALLAIKGGTSTSGISIKDLAERLLIRHHSAVGLVDRLQRAGLISRDADAADRRRVTVVLTRKAEHALKKLAALHRKELRRLAPAMTAILEKV